MKNPHVMLIDLWPVQKQHATIAPILNAMLRMRQRVIQVVEWAITHDVPVSVFNHLRTLPSDPPQLRQVLERAGKSFDDDWFRPDAAGPHNRGVRIANAVDWQSADTLIYVGNAIDECLGTRPVGFCNTPASKRKVIVVDATVIQPYVIGPFHYWPEYYDEHRIPRRDEPLRWQSADELEAERDYFAATYASCYADLIMTDELVGSYARRTV